MACQHTRPLWHNQGLKLLVCSPGGMHSSCIEWLHRQWGKGEAIVLLDRRLMLRMAICITIHPGAIVVVVASLLRLMLLMLHTHLTHVGNCGSTEAIAIVLVNRAIVKVRVRSEEIRVASWASAPKPSCSWTRVTSESAACMHA